jgi:NAD(P)-dependent dehydrogenase (short-subunit alcohol dehydrogenase family)
MFGRSLRKVGAGLRTAVVTGGASGIVNAVAQRLRKGGFRVAVIDLSPAASTAAATPERQ